MDSRLQLEIDLIRTAFPLAAYKDRWVLLPRFWMPSEWSPAEPDIAIFLRPPYPAISPYGIYAPAGMTFRGQAPQNYAVANPPPPFPGAWWIFSWEAEEWQPSTEITKGHNLLTWVVGIKKRFSEGA